MVRRTAVAGVRSPGPRARERRTPGRRPAFCAEAAPPCVSGEAQSILCVDSDECSDSDSAAQDRGAARRRGGTRVTRTWCVRGATQGEGAPLSPSTARPRRRRQPETCGTRAALSLSRGGSRCIRPQGGGRAAVGDALTPRTPPGRGLSCAAREGRREWREQAEMPQHAAPDARRVRCAADNPRYARLSSSPVPPRGGEARREAAREEGARPAGAEGDALSLQEGGRQQRVAHLQLQAMPRGLADEEYRRPAFRRLYEYKPNREET